MTDFIPTEAQTPARAPPALPEEAVVIILAPASRALMTSSALGRSFNEPVGFLPSSFINTAFNPSWRARDSQFAIGVQPTTRDGKGESSLTGRSGRYLHIEDWRSCWRAVRDRFLATAP